MAPMALCCSSSAASSDAPWLKEMSSAKWIGSNICKYVFFQATNPPSRRDPPSDLGHLEEAVLGRLRHPRVIRQRQLDGGQLPHRRGGRLEAVTTSAGLLIVVVGEECHGGDPWGRDGSRRHTLLDGPALGRHATTRGKCGQQGTPKSGLTLQSSEGCGVQTLCLEFLWQKRQKIRLSKMAKIVKVRLKDPGLTA